MSKSWAHSATYVMWGVIIAMCTPFMLMWHLATRVVRALLEVPRSKHSDLELELKSYHVVIEGCSRCKEVFSYPLLRVPKGRPYPDKDRPGCFVVELDKICPRCLDKEFPSIRSRYRQGEFCPRKFWSPSASGELVLESTENE